MEWESQSWGIIFKPITHKPRSLSGEGIKTALSLSHRKTTDRAIGRSEKRKDHETATKGHTFG